MKNMIDWISTCHGILWYGFHFNHSLYCTECARSYQTYQCQDHLQSFSLPYLSFTHFFLSCVPSELPPPLKLFFSFSYSQFFLLSEIHFWSFSFLQQLTPQFSSQFNKYLAWTPLLITFHFTELNN